MADSDNGGFSEFLKVAGQYFHRFNRIREAARRIDERYPGGSLMTRERLKALRERLERLGPKADVRPGEMPYLGHVIFLGVEDKGPLLRRDVLDYAFVLLSEPEGRRWTGRFISAYMMSSLRPFDVPDSFLVVPSPGPCPRVSTYPRDAGHCVSKPTSSLAAGTTNSSSPSLQRSHLCTK